VDLDGVDEVRDGAHGTHANTIVVEVVQQRKEDLDGLLNIRDEARLHLLSVAEAGKILESGKDYKKRRNAAHIMLQAVAFSSNAEV